ncbi:MAG: hypothetical protein Ta2B_28210 [Termitinemataceae bacterium]|nr:MAG: hypothetical protein Ta2B_28210 [Termitinemataceae bacterium]
MKKIFIVLTFSFLLVSCEDVIYNDLALQGEWEKDCEVDYENVRMRIKFDADTFCYKKASADDWENTISASASFGVLYIKQAETVSGSYNIVWSKCLFSGFKHESGLMWLNGVWDKK